MDFIHSRTQSWSTHDAWVQLATQFPDSIPLLARILANIENDVTSLRKTDAQDKGSPVIKSESTPVADSILQPPFAMVNDVGCLVPRGKHSISLTEKGIAFYNSAQAKKQTEDVAPSIIVPTSNVSGVFLLQNPDKYNPSNVSWTIVISLHKPVLVGKTEHSVLGIGESGSVLQKSKAASVTLLRPVEKAALFNAEALESICSNSSALSEGSTLTAKHSMDLLARCFGAIFGRVGEPDKNIFISSTGQTSFRAVHKVNEGELYPYRRAFIFGPRPLLVIPHSKIASVQLGRGGGVTSRSFDINITVEGSDSPINLSMIDAAELDMLRQYISTRTFGGNKAPSASTKQPVINAAEPLPTAAFPLPSYPSISGAAAIATATAREPAAETKKETFGERNEEGSAASESASEVHSRGCTMNDESSAEESDDSDDSAFTEDESEESAFESDDENSDDDSGEGGNGTSSEEGEEENAGHSAATEDNAKTRQGRKRSRVATGDGEDSEATEDDDALLDSDISDSELKALQEDSGLTTEDALVSEGPTRARRRRRAGAATASQLHSAALSSAAGDGEETEEE